MFASELITLIVLNWGRSIEDIVRKECENQFSCVESVLGRWLFQIGVEFPSKYCTPRRKRAKRLIIMIIPVNFCDFKLFMKRHGVWFSATPAFKTPSNQTFIVLDYDHKLITSPPSAEVVFRSKQINYTWKVLATQEIDTWVQLVWKNVISWIPPVFSSSNGSCHWHNTTFSTRYNVLRSYAGVKNRDERKNSFSDKLCWKKDILKSKKAREEDGNWANSSNICFRYSKTFGFFLWK